MRFRDILMASAQGGGGYLPNTRAWIAAVVAAGGTVSSAQAGYVNTLEGALATAGALPLLDRLWLFAAENATQALIDLVARSTATAVNSPTFTASQGYAGNGTTSYVNSNFNPTSTPGQFVLNSASVGVYTRTDRTAGAIMANIGGEGSTGTGLLEFLPWYTDDKTYTIVNGSAETAINPHVSATVKGLWIVARTGSGGLTVYRNGASVGTTSDASNTLLNNTVLFGANRGGGSPIQFSTDQNAVGLIGAGFTAGQSLAFYTAIQAYMTSLGTQV